MSVNGAARPPPGSRALMAATMHHHHTWKLSEGSVDERVRRTISGFLKRALACPMPAPLMAKTRTGRDAPVIWHWHIAFQLCNLHRLSAWHAVSAFSMAAHTPAKFDGHAACEYYGMNSRQEPGPPKKPSNSAAIAMIVVLVVIAVIVIALIKGSRPTTDAPQNGMPSNIPTAPGSSPPR